jgi:hypothetical protein
VVVVVDDVVVVVVGVVEGGRVVVFVVAVRVVDVIGEPYPGQDAVQYPHLYVHKSDSYTALNEHQPTPPYSSNSAQVL